YTTHGRRLTTSKRLLLLATPLIRINHLLPHHTKHNLTSLWTRSFPILEGHVRFLWPLLTLSRPTRASSLPLLPTGLASPSSARLHATGLGGLRNFSPGAIRVCGFQALHS